MTDSKPGQSQPGEPGSSAERAAAEGSDQLQPADSARPADGPYAGRARKGMFNVTGTGDTSGFGGLRLPEPTVPPAERPYGGWFDELADQLYAAMSERGVPAEAIIQVTVDRSELTFFVRGEQLPALCLLLRDDAGLRFELCSSVSGVDYGPEVPQRLHSVYHLTSMTYRRRIRLDVPLADESAHVPSVVDTYPTADWQERETYDMFGIVYDGHPGLTRILMPDDWEGHPQRKDYPLGGIPVEYKGTEIPPPDQRRSYT